MTNTRPKYPSELNRWMVSVPLDAEDSALLKTLALREQRPYAQYMRKLLRDAARQANLVAPVESIEAQLSQ